MPKLSLSATDAVKGGSSFHAMDGIWKINRAYSVVHQFQPNKDTGEQGPPTTMIALDLLKCDPSTFEPAGDEEVLTEILGLGSKNTLEHVHPGRMAKPEDDDAEDLGTELGTEGNSVSVDTLDVKTYDNCTWMKFSSSLIEAGFKPELLGTSYLPYLDGTIFEVKRTAGYKAPGKVYKVEPTDLGVKRIIVFGYESKKTAGKGAAAKKPAGTSASAPAAGSTTESATGEVNSTALAAVLEIAAQQKNKPAMKRALFQAQIMTYLMKKTKLSMKEKNDLMNATVKDDEWLANTAAENGFVVDFTADGGKGTLEFPAE